MAGVEIRIGVSTCLLGERVRYDGGHKRDPFVTGPLSRLVSFVAVCPEVEMGLGTPREAIRLENATDSRGVRLVGRTSGDDHTTAMRRFARRRVKELASLDLSGYILKQGSPSCGVRRVRVAGAGGDATRHSGRGLFASALIDALPDLPVEEEEGLQDPHRGANFVERVLAYGRLQAVFAGRWTINDLERFNATEELLLDAHDHRAHAALTRLVGGTHRGARRVLRRAYRATFMAALARPTTVAKHTRVLRKIRARCRRQVPDTGQAELVAVIEDYRRGVVPLEAPLTLVRRLARRYRVVGLDGHSYLAPHPEELLSQNR